MSCDHSNITDILNRLEKFQGGGQRHVCAGCAFELGVQHRQKGSPFNPGAVDGLPNSQAGSQRHRNAYQAYKLGYERGA